MNVAFEKGQKAGFNLINPAACPYFKYSREFREWLCGHMEGREARNMVRGHEMEVYRHDPQRYDLLWGIVD